MINVWWIWDPTKQFGPRVHTLASSSPRSRLLHSTLSSHGVTLRGCYFILMMVTKTRVSNDVLKGCIAWMRQRQDPAEGLCVVKAPAAHRQSRLPPFVDLWPALQGATDTELKDVLSGRTHLS